VLGWGFVTARAPNVSAMDRTETLNRFDLEMRRDPPTEPGDVVERSGTIVRIVGNRAWIAYSHLSEAEAPLAVEEEAIGFRRRGVPVEWKLFGHDGPRALPELLQANGFVADPPETLMVIDLRDPMNVGRPADGVEVRKVEDRRGLETAVAVSHEAFAPGPGWDLSDYLRSFGTPGLGVFLATVNGRPVSAGRIDLPTGRSFAGLYGGGTAPAFRGRGIYRALVAARAELARERGFRYLTVDALETSRPILERVGFQPLTSVVGWVLTP
jgi:GNAT superfamily N-acetyltransferase